MRANRPLGLKSECQSCKAAKDRVENAEYRRSGRKVSATWRRQEEAAGRPRPPGCEVCGRTNKSGRALAFDHCHTRGHFRGWLCDPCNTSLGLMEDNPEYLRKLTAYLERDQATP